MFEDLAPEDVLAAVSAADFDAEPWDLGSGRIDAIAALERLVRVAQARIVEQVDSLYRDRLTHYLPGATDHRLSVAAEVAMARNVSPTAGRSLFQLSMGLRLMPHARRAFGDGVISEPTARAIVRELELVAEDTMGVIDDELAEHLPGLTPKRAANLVRELLVTHDQVAAEERSRNARADQWVAYYPGPDGVGTLVAHGPAEQLVALHASLQRHADSRRAKGDPRDRGQIMLSSLFERGTGLVQVEGCDVELSVVMPIEALQGEPVAAHLSGHGPIPPGVAAQIVDAGTTRWFRRLFTDAAGNLDNLDVRRRCFTGHLAHWIRARDHDVCRGPGCDCRARQIDHVTPFARGGPTTQANGQAVCQLTNQVKELPGWSARADSGGVVTWTTPTGHTYTSPPPRPIRRT